MTGVRARRLVVVGEAAFQGHPQALGEVVFHAQAGIYKTGDADAALNKIAKDAGLSDAQANACLSDKAAIDALNARVQGYINNDKISGTPTFFVDGERLEGVQTLVQLDAAIARAEARAAALWGA